MEFFIQMVMDFLGDNWYSVISTILAGGFFAKYVVARKLVGGFVEAVKSVHNAHEDGVVSPEEYEDIGRKADAFAMELYGRLKGLFLNKSEV